MGQLKTSYEIAIEKSNRGFYDEVLSEKIPPDSKSSPESNPSLKSVIMGFIKEANNWYPSIFGSYTTTKYNLRMTSAGLFGFIVSHSHDICCSCLSSLGICKCTICSDRTPDRLFRRRCPKIEWPQKVRGARKVKRFLKQRQHWRLGYFLEKVHKWAESNNYTFDVYVTHHSRNGHELYLYSKEPIQGEPIRFV